MARDEQGRWLKGESPCPGGRAQETIGLRAELKQRKPEALKRFDELLASSDEKVALEAVKVWLSFVLPKPRQSLTVKSEGESLLKGIPPEVLAKWAAEAAEEGT